MNNEASGTNPNYYEPIGYLHASHPRGSAVASVLIDGLHHHAVVEADDIQGWARVMVRGADGKFIIENDEAATEVLRGQVRFVWRD